MKVTKLISSFICFFAILHSPSSLLAQQLTISDPLKNYLDSKVWENNTQTDFYTDDTILQLRLDFNQDGSSITLFSLNRDADGRAGNVWVAYSRNSNKGGYKKLGTLTFHSNGFYFGYIEEVQHYGIINTLLGGAGEGSFVAYYLESGAIKEQIIGKFDRYDVAKNGTQKAGKRMAKKYAPKLALPEPGARLLQGKNYEGTSLEVVSLANKYNLSVQPVPLE